MTWSSKLTARSAARSHEAPPHSPLAAGQLWRTCADVLEGGGPAGCVVAADRTGDAVSGARPRLTRFPFLKIILQGRIELASPAGPARTVRAGEAVLFVRDTFARVDYPARTSYLRFTFCDGHVFAGRETVSAGGPSPRVAGRPRGELEACQIEGGPGALAERLLERLSELRDDAPLAAVQRRALAQALLAELTAWLGPGGGAMADQRGGGLVARMRRHVEEHCREPIDRAAVAKAFGVTTGHVSRVFRLAGGEGFHATLLRARLDLARDLLRRTEWPIEDVAAASGFASSGYFSAAFRRATGLPPLRWRRREA